MTIIPLLPTHLYSQSESVPSCPKKISDYLASQDLRIKNLIGKGVQGSVYTLENTKTGKEEHVLKLNNFFFKKPFLENRGPHLVQQIHHDGICSPTQLFYLTASKDLALSPSPGATYVGMVMPLIEGKPLLETWPELLQKAERVFLFSAFLVEAVNEFAKHSIAHRDLHACNILVTKDDKPKIIDSDLCKKQTVLSREDYKQLLRYLCSMIRDSPDMNESAKKYLKSCMEKCYSILWRDAYQKPNGSSELPALLRSFMQACVEHLDEIKPQSKL